MEVGIQAEPEGTLSDELERRASAVALFEVVLQDVQADPVRYSAADRIHEEHLGLFGQRVEEYAAVAAGLKWDAAFLPDSAVQFPRSLLVRFLVLEWIDQVDNIKRD